MENIIKIASIAVVASLCAVTVKKQTPELGVVLSAAAGVLILSFGLPALKSIKELVETLSAAAELTPAVVTPVIKTVGIAIITKVTAELCRDTKEGGVAAFVEVVGSAGALLVCLPMLEMVLSIITEML